MWRGSVGSPRELDIDRMLLDRAAGPVPSTHQPVDSFYVVEF